MLFARKAESSTASKPPAARLSSPRDNRLVLQKGMPFLRSVSFFI